MGFYKCTNHSTYLMFAQYSNEKDNACYSQLTGKKLDCLQDVAPTSVLSNSNMQHCLQKIPCKISLEGLLQFHPNSLPGDPLQARHVVTNDIKGGIVMIVRLLGNAPIKSKANQTLLN